MANQFDIGTRIAFGEPGTAGYDTGIIKGYGDPDGIDPTRDRPKQVDDLWVSWDSGEQTWIAAEDCRPL